MKSIDRIWHIDDLLAEFPAATQLIDRALLNLSRPLKHPVEVIKMTLDELRFPLFCPGDTVDHLYRFIRDSGLVTEWSWSSSGLEFLISPRGWQRLHELSKTPTDSRQAFVAMWFTTETDQVYKEGIEPAVREAEYEPKRIDLVEHNNKICDEIIAEIRRSRFLIADFTGQRGGVYFEAGFAMGLGIPVIWIVPKDQIDKVHFDTRQYNHIVYESPDDLASKLYNRIAATIR
ncbi:MAG: hypothetical protein GWP08_21185 [Nitrospiraceae bacterium]|nr:hypothetical protein [Nitrospiraceae bacterium]